MRTRGAFHFRVDSKTLFRLAAVVPLALFAAAMLAACGGADSTTGDADTGAATTARSEFVAPLFDDDGNSLPVVPAARPADSGVRMNNGRYATSAQARLLMEVRKADVLEIDVSCCGIEAVDFAVVSVWIDQLARSLPDSAPVFVRGSDLRLAALAANRIASGGLANTWLVTQ